MDFLSFLSMKEEITNHCLVMNSVSNVARTIRYLNDRHLTHIRVPSLTMMKQDGGLFKIS